MRRLKACAIAVGLILSVPSAMADPATPAPSSPAGKPDVATLLFETPQWATAPAGTVITYAYKRMVTQPAYGPSFDDKIVLTLEKGDAAANRTIDVKMFTGPRAKAAGPFETDTQNPVLLLALEANVEELSSLWHANPRYLKDAIRKAWRDDAKIENVPIQVDGKTVPGTRVTVEPFQNDPDKEKMGELETMLYTVEIADSVPGQIATIDIHGPATGQPSFSETLTYQSEKTP